MNFAATAASRRLYWFIVILWAVAAWQLGTRLADSMKWRINDLAAVPQAGQIERDPEGTYYHVNMIGRARAIYPVLAPAAYEGSCYDCALVSGDQLAHQNDFCAAAVRSQLPHLDFEIPCRSWAPISDGPALVAVALFLAPLLLWPLTRGLWRIAVEGLAAESAR